MSLASSAARTVPPAAAPLLDHAVRTDPEPLEANLSGPSPADLRVVVSNSGNVAVRCTSIVIELPVGSRPRDLASTGVGIEASTTTPGWVRTGQTVSPTQARFEFEPSTDEAAVITEDPLTFKVDRVPVNSSVGVAYPLITETSAIRQDTPQAREGYARLPKFPAGTTATLPVGTNLRVHVGEQPIEGRPPAVRVPHGSKVTVAWNPARDVVRHLHYEDKEAGTPIAEGATQLVCGPLYRETTFTLQTVSQVNGQPVSRYDSFTLQVDVPEYPRVNLPNGTLGHVDPPGLTITSPVRTEKLLTVKEAMHGKNTASITGRLEAPTIKAAATQFGGTLEVAGTFTANNLTAAKVTTSRGLTATGRVNILKAGHTPLPASGSQTFPTDGLILASATDHADLELWVDTPSHKFRNVSWGRVGTLVAPVKAEQPITWGGSGTGYTFSWYPFGT
ncbi:hypothetical protein ACIGXM_11805 [Kitasatospora sp. NPDC052896]|uniref:hypothetical protein n=1 Tax=Kitasatospora sp. NPDC052896 TaxID=3364061 RepID=UPI0037CA6D5D